MERAILVIPRRILDQLEEALSLSETAGYRVERIVKTRLSRRVGKGFIEDLARTVKEAGTETVIFYGDLQPSSRFLLMKRTKARIIDRVTLILEIFAKHAGSREAKLQIEMARIRHEIPLVRELIRRSKMGEYPGFLGPGGYAIDSYYRHLTKRLAKLRRELETLRRLRGERLRNRSRSGLRHVSIIGYASAGKTSIFNKITGESKPVGPEYFTTLHPKHKAISVDGVRLVLVDTVGFIRDVPPEVVEAFYSTLEEITLSDLAIFVVDVSEPDNYIREKLSAGFETLAKIGAGRVPLIIAANKIDLLGPRVDEKLGVVKEAVSGVNARIQAIIPVSARSGAGLDLILAEAARVARDGATPRAGRAIR